MRFLIDIAQFQIVQVLVFGSLFLGVYYFTLYDDGSSKRRDIENIKKNIVQAKVELKKKTEELNDMKKFEKELLREEDLIKAFINFIPSSLTFTELSTLLINEARKAGVNVESKQDKGEESDKKEKEYNALKIELNINGAFSNIMRFLSRLTDQKRMFIVKNINMRIDQQETVVKAKLEVFAYRYEKLEEDEDQVR